MKIKFLLTDNNGNRFEGEAELAKVIRDAPLKNKQNTVNWYQPNSTISKLMDLLTEGFFNKNQSIKDIIIKLESRDYHYKHSDLTLPLRKIVRRGFLERVKNDEEKNKKWAYRKIS